MGILDAIKGKVDALDKTYDPFRKVADALTTAPKPTPTPPMGVAADEQPSPPQQTPVPRAKGGCVMKGGAPMCKNVDNSGLKKEPC